MRPQNGAIQGLSFVARPSVTYTVQWSTIAHTNTDTLHVCIETASLLGRSREGLRPVLSRASCSIVRSGAAGGFRTAPLIKNCSQKNATPEFIEPPVGVSDVSQFQHSNEPSGATPEDPRPRTYLSGRFISLHMFLFSYPPTTQLATSTHLHSPC